jgi:hypothetical protein
VRHLLEHLSPDGQAAPSACDIDALAARLGRPRTTRGFPLCFSPAPPDRLAYEARIAACGCVATRDHDWHDTFNALVWLAFPQIKAAINQRHGEEHARLPGGGAMRGPVRDALTQFDEEGLVLVSDDTALLDALRDHRWRDALFERRAAVMASKLFVIGHGLMDKARAPYVGLCAKALHLCSATVGRPLAGVTAAYLDGWLAGQICAGRWPHSPRDLHPLPVLGLPGMTPDNTCAAYFEDMRQFRPRAFRHLPA